MQSNSKVIVILESYSVCDNELSYTIEINSDRSISYNDMKDTHAQTKKSSIISESDIRRLFDHIQHIYFFTLNERYVSSSNKSDSRVCYSVSVTVDGKSKKITFDENQGTPIGLRALRALVESIAKSVGLNF